MELAPAPSSVTLFGDEEAPATFPLLVPVVCVAALTCPLAPQAPRARGTATTSAATAARLFMKLPPGRSIETIEPVTLLDPWVLVKESPGRERTRMVAPYVASL